MKSDDGIRKHLLDLAPPDFNLILFSCVRYNCFALY